MSWNKKTGKHISTTSWPRDREIVDQLDTDAKNWGCCSVSELILPMDPRWAELPDNVRDRILRNYPELHAMGMSFMEAVEKTRYRLALKLHKQIQNYDLGAMTLRGRINDTLGVMS